MGIIKDYTGKKFNKFTVIERVEPFDLKSGQHARWKCKCECGAEKIVLSNNLKNIKRCNSCLNIRKDLTNKIVGRLKVISASHSNGRDIYWNCDCQCGNKCKIKTTSLIQERTKSCGCLVLDTISLPPTQAAINRIIDRYKRGAIDRNLKWELTYDQTLNCLKGLCNICGSTPNQISKTVNGIFYYNGIDRIDNNKGYITDNIQSSCYKCNYMKKDLSMYDFLDHIKIIHSWSIKNNGN